MALLDRVATLLRANLNDLLDKAENPEKMLKQIILDMENQFMQVKTQLAVAVADLHLLEQKKQEHAGKLVEWMRKAELAVEKNDDQLARAALERAMGFEQLTGDFDHQIGRQEAQVESLKNAMQRLEVKLAEARGKVELLIVRHRRSRSAHRAADAQHSAPTETGVFERMRTKVAIEEALGTAKNELFDYDVDVRLHALEREKKIDSLLKDLKARKGASA
ncbi:MAG TPA: PspA/IM30 family protein [Candidatus Binataceae bacterium]|nr:PspA/IM30 family protein [Candidatus Binataceae bacterium]